MRVMTGTLLGRVRVAAMGDGGVLGCSRHDGLNRSASRLPSLAGVGPHGKGSPGPPEGLPTIAS